jgi:hypothetical protein
MFDSPADFLANVTEHGLRRFWSIKIEVIGAASAFKFRMAWVQPPTFFLERFLYGRRRANVDLEMTATATASAAAAFPTVRTAALRGGSGTTVLRQMVVVASIFLGFSGALFAGIQFALYLVNVSVLVGNLFITTTAVVGTLLAIPLALWAYPAIEVAPLGASNLIRMSKTIAAAVVPLVIGGIAKALYG